MPIPLSPEKEAAPRVRLAYVVNSLNAGGTEKLVVEMSKAFAVDHAVDVICLDEPGTWAGSLRDSGISVYCLWRQPGLDLGVSVRLARMLRQRRYDIVHAHQCTAWFYAALARLLYAAPRLLLEEHGRFFPETEHVARRLLNRWLIRRLTRRFVAVSADIRRRLERYEGLKAADIDVVYNGVTPPQTLSPVSRDGLRRELGFSGEDFVVGTVGRFDRIKNLQLLIGSIARARRLNPGVRGLLVGDGPEFAAIRTLITQHDLDDCIRLTGFREDARRLAQCMDLFVLSSLSEGTSMALLEAMAAGVPAAVTDVGGNPEVVLGGITGWVVPSDSVPALTAAIEEAVNDPARRQLLAAAGQRRFADQFTFAAMIARYREIYREMLGSAVQSGSAATL